MADNRVQQLISQLKAKSDLTEDMKNTEYLIMRIYKIYLIALKLKKHRLKLKKNLK